MIMQYNPLDHQTRDRDSGEVRWHEFDADEAAVVLADLSDAGHVHPLGLQRLLEHVLTRLDDTRPDPDPAEVPERTPERGPDPWDDPPAPAPGDSTPLPAPHPRHARPLTAG